MLSRPSKGRAVDYTHINSEVQNELIGERIKQLEEQHYQNELTLRLVEQDDEETTPQEAEQLDALRRTQEKLERGIQALRGEIASNLGATGVNAANGGANRQRRRAAAKKG